MHRMAGIGADWLGITHIALTHFHPDHTLDLTTLVLRVEIRHAAAAQRAAGVLGPPGTAALVQRFAELYGGAVSEPTWPLKVTEMPFGSGVELGDGVRLESLKVPHTDESVAYSIARGGRRIVFTGDTGESDSLGDWARGCDLLLAECSLPDAMAIPTHLTPRQCAALAAARDAGASGAHAFLFGGGSGTSSRAVALRYDGPVTLTEDGWFTDFEESSMLVVMQHGANAAGDRCRRSR